MGKKLDLRGRVFGRLTVWVENGRDKGGRVLWLCICECGNLKTVLGNSLIRGITRSCGCLSKEMASNRLRERNFKHGLSRHPIYDVWRGIMRRCYDPLDQAYCNYGGRGISVYEPWHDLVKFYEDVMKLGWQHGLEIDRYPNNDGNYEPSNVRFVSCEDNNNNRRTSHFVEYENKILTLSQWGREKGIPGWLISQRLRRGFSIEDAFYVGNLQVRNNLLKKEGVRL